MFYFKFNIGDYASHTRHLTLVEDIAYRRLLEAYYLSERPLTESIAAVARHIRMREYEKEVGDVLNEFFTLSELGWSNVRADREIEDYHAKIKQASDAGKTSAKRRLNKNPTTVERPLNDRCDSVEPTNKQETVNKKQETYSVSKDTGAKAPLTPDEIIFGYGLPLLTNAGTDEKQARSFLGGLRKSHGDDALVDGLRECIKAKPLQPLEWLAKVLPPKGAPPKRNKQEQLEDRNRAIVDRLLAKENQ